MLPFPVAQHPNSGPDHLVSRFLDHTQLQRTHPLGLLWARDQLVAVAATYTAHNKHKRQTSMPSVGFEPAIPAIEGPQTYALDHMATGFSKTYIIRCCRRMFVPFELWIMNEGKWRMCLCTPWSHMRGWTYSCSSFILRVRQYSCGRHYGSPKRRYLLVELRNKLTSTRQHNKYLLEYIGHMFRPINRSSSGLKQNKSQVLFRYPNIFTIVNAHKTDTG